MKHWLNQGLIIPPALHSFLQSEQTPTIREQPYKRIITELLQFSCNMRSHSASDLNMLANRLLAAEKINWYSLYIYLNILKTCFCISISYFVFLLFIFHTGLALTDLHVCFVLYYYMNDNIKSKPSTQTKPESPWRWDRCLS